MRHWVTSRGTFLAVAAGALFAGGFWFARVSQQDVARSVAVQVSTTGKSSETPPRETASSQRAEDDPGWARALTRRIAHLEQRIDKAPTQGIEATESSQAPVEPPSLTVEERIVRNQERIQRIDRALESEPHDGKWSHETTKVLEDLFAAVVPAGSTLADTTCGETFCRLVVRHENHEARNDFEVFPRKMPGMGVRGLIEHRDDGTEQTTLYVVRKEYDSPEHPVRRQDQG